VELLLTRDIDGFADRVQQFVEERLERNVFATVLMNVRAGASDSDHPPLFAYGVEHGGSVCAAAMRTPPWPMLADGFERPDDAEALAAAWLTADPDVDGVTGAPACARSVVSALAARSGREAKLRFSEAMHMLDAVAPLPYGARGRLRVAEDRDRSVLIVWEEAFAIETGFGRTPHADRRVERRLRAGLQFVWDDGGQPVSTAAVNQTVAGVARIGPVYTPPEHRGRGYATCLVADLSEQALSSGAERCMLFTDLANPTSNKIYALIGYRRCGDWEEHLLTPRGQALSG
jgi:predicted GNAT family acetyltransferase